MNKMDIEANSMRINIRKALLESVRLEFVDYEGKPYPYPKVSVNVHLMTEAGAKITTVTLSTDNYTDLKKLKDLPLTIYDRIGDIVAMLMPQAVVQLNGIEKLITSEGEKSNE